MDSLNYRQTGRDDLHKQQHPGRTGGHPQKTKHILDRLDSRSIDRQEKPQECGHPAQNGDDQCHHILAGQSRQLAQPPGAKRQGKRPEKNGDGRQTIIFGIPSHD